MLHNFPTARCLKWWEMLHGVRIFLFLLLLLLGHWCLKFSRLDVDEAENSGKGDILRCLLTAVPQLEFCIWERFFLIKIFRNTTALEVTSASQSLFLLFLIVTSKFKVNQFLLYAYNISYVIFKKYFIFSKDSLLHEGDFSFLCEEIRRLKPSEKTCLLAVLIINLLLLNYIS